LPANRGPRRDRGIVDREIEGEAASVIDQLQGVRPKEPRNVAADLIKKLTVPRAGSDGPAPPLAWVPALIPALGAPLRIDRPMEGTLGRMGSLEVRLARGPAEIQKAQALRYKVFYEEMSAVANPAVTLLRRDADFYDAICDHVLVLDHSIVETKPFRKPEPKVVATYRLLRGEVADTNGGYYTAGEFELDAFLARNAGRRLLELGRSCVLKPYRNKRTVELLWHGVWTYIRHHRIDAMFGCASLEGTDPRALSLPLSYLHHHHRAPEDWRVRALANRYVEMDRLSANQIDLKGALHALPPLVKGYLRLGAWVGDGAVVDHQFGTTDVFIVLAAERISSRYIEYFGADATRHAGPRTA